MIRKTLLRLIKNNLTLYLSLIFINILESLLSVFMPLISGYLIGSLLNIYKGNIIKYLSLHIAINVLLLGIQYIKGVVLNKLSVSILYFFRMSFYKKFINSTFASYNSTKSGKILSIFTNDIQYVSSFFCDKIISIFNTSMLLIAMFSITLYMDFYIGIFLIISTPSFYFIYRILKKYLKKQYILTKKMYDNMLTGLQETINGFIDICLLNISTIMIQRFNDKLNSHIYQKKLTGKIIIISQISLSILGLIQDIGILCVIIFLGKKDIHHISLYVAVMVYIQKIIQGLLMLSSFTTEIHNADISLKRLYETFPIISMNYTKRKIPDNISGKLEFKNISFSYINDKQVLDNLNFIIKPNMINVIQGKNGAGKSTIIGLICKLYEPSVGKIYLDNTDIMLYDTDSYREKIAIVKQEPFLFNLSIFDNMLLVDKYLDLNKLRAICKDIDMDDFIMSLPMQYNTIIEEASSNLSLGQRQKLTIVRALLKNAKINIFDEALSSLDKESASRVANLIYHQSRHSTVIIVEHRNIFLTYPCNIINIPFYNS